MMRSHYFVGCDQVDDSLPLLPDGKLLYPRMSGFDDLEPFLVMGQVIIQELLEVVFLVEDAMYVVFIHVPDFPIALLVEHQRTASGCLIGAHIHLAPDAAVESDLTLVQSSGVCFAV